MLAFAERTGLASGRPSQRYLWTDAFAVCNFLGLRDATGEERYAELALRLVDDVHWMLGRHRSDDLRRGWISGLGEDGGAAHPTRGGLRIGKELPEQGTGTVSISTTSPSSDGPPEPPRSAARRGRAPVAACRARTTSSAPDGEGPALRQACRTDTSSSSTPSTSPSRSTPA